MRLSRYWPLSVLRGEGGLSLRPWGGCSCIIGRSWFWWGDRAGGREWYRDSPAASTPAGKLAAEWIEHGNEALARGDLAQALDDFNKAVDAQPDSAKAHERRAAAYWQLKKPDQALNDCDLALRFDSKLASASFTRGLVERDLGESDKRWTISPRPSPMARRGLTC